MKNIVELVKSLKQNPEILEAFLKFWSVFLALFADAKSTGNKQISEYEPDLVAAHREFSEATLGQLLRCYDIDKPHIEYQGQTYRRNPATKATYTGIDGPITISRHTYRNTSGGAGICPLEMNAGLIEAKYTPGAAELVQMGSACDDYRQVCALFHKAQLLKCSKSAMHRDMKKIGERIHEEMDALNEALISTIKPIEGAVSVSVSLDRTGIPTEEELSAKEKQNKESKFKVVKRQAYCGSLTIHDSEAKSLQIYRFAALPDEGDCIQSRMKEALEAIQEENELEVILISDGASEMLSRVRQIAGDSEVSIQLVDCYHSLQYLSDAIEARRGVGMSYAQLKEILITCDDGAAQVLGLMRSWSVKKNKADKYQASIRFFENHLHQMQYANARAQGFVIGSGSVESTCKCVVATRMKRNGSRWKPPGSRPIIHTRALLKSSQTVWDSATTVLWKSYHTPVSA